MKEPRCCTSTRVRRAFSLAGPFFWNSLPMHLHRPTVAFDHMQQTFANCLATMAYPDIQLGGQFNMLPVSHVYFFVGGVKVCSQTKWERPWTYMPSSWRAYTSLQRTLFVCMHLYACSMDIWILINRTIHGLWMLSLFCNGRRLNADRGGAVSLRHCIR